MYTYCPRCKGRNVRFVRPTGPGQALGGLLGLTILGRLLAGDLVRPHWKCLDCGHRIGSYR